ncbi:MAG: PAS domain S-box protein, partial [Deltaproteobacteria bacterium]
SRESVVMKKKKIMVVEDELITAKYLQKALVQLGYEVASVVATGEDAVAAVAEDEPDLILLDIVLRGEMDGIEAADEIRRITDVPIIYVTAYGSEEILERVKITEPFAYLIKPVDERDLRTSIEIAFSKHDTEQTLRQSEERLTGTLRSIGWAVIAADQRGRVILMNHVAEELTGITQEAALGKSLAQVIGIRDERTGKTIAPLIREVIAKNVKVSSSGHEYGLTSKDGTPLSVEFTIAPVRDTADTVLGTILVFRDVTELKTLQKILIKAKREWEQSMDSISHLIAIVDKQRRIIRCNKAMATSLGVTPQKAIGMTCCGAFHDEPLDEENCPHAQCMADKMEHSVEFFSKKLNLTLLVNSAPFYDPAGRLIGALHVARDISDIRKEEEALRNEQAELSQYSESLAAQLEQRTGELAQARDELETYSADIEKNSEALRMLIQGIEQREQDLQEKAAANVKLCIKPLIDQLKAQNLPDANRFLVESLERQMGNIFSSFGRSLVQISHLLTPREMQICELIQSGLTSKQIGGVMGVSTETVNAHRVRIRKKLGLDATRENLAGWLRSNFNE